MGFNNKCYVVSTGNVKKTDLYINSSSGKRIRYTEKRKRPWNNITKLDIKANGSHKGQTSQNTITDHKQEEDILVLRRRYDKDNPHFHFKAYS